MCISLRTHTKERYERKRKIVLKLLNVYVTVRLIHGKLYESCRTWKSLRTLTKASCIKVAECIYHYLLISRKDMKSYRMSVYHCVLIPRKVVLKQRMCISLRTHTKESWFKVLKCVYHSVLIARKVVLKLQNVLITALLIPRKVVLKLRNVYITAYSQQGRFF